MYHHTMGHRPRFMKGLLLFGLGVLVASALAGSTIGFVGLMFAVPFLLFKLFLIVFFIKMVMRFAGGPPRTSGSTRPDGPTRPEPSGDSEWQEHLRQARDEVEELEKKLRGFWQEATDRRTGSNSEPDDETDAEEESEGAVRD